MGIVTTQFVEKRMWPDSGDWTNIARMWRVASNGRNAVFKQTGVFEQVEEKNRRPLRKWRCKVRLKENKIARVKVRVSQYCVAGCDYAQPKYFPNPYSALSAAPKGPVDWVNLA